jgi:hypothetical protein
MDGGQTNNNDPSLLLAFTKNKQEGRALQDGQ